MPAKITRHGYAAAAMALLAVLIAMAAFLFILSSAKCARSIPAYDNTTQPTSSVLPEKEATEYQGIKLVPIKSQGNNAIEGTRHIDKAKYRLEVTGLVDHDLSMSYDDLLQIPAISEAVYMPCVEGWGFTAKWTGFKVMDLLDKAGVKPNATYVMFYSDDGYSSGHPIQYLKDNDIILAYGLNDITLPDDRGWPFQLVAKNKYGYKWAKWITKIEVLDHEELGYWEQRGYSNAGDVGK